MDLQLRENFSFFVDSPIHTASVAGRVVILYAGSGPKSQVAAFSLESGELLWKNDAQTEGVVHHAYTSRDARCYLLLDHRVQVRDVASGRVIGEVARPDLGAKV